MKKRVRAVQFGCGPVGCLVVRYTSTRPDIKIVGAIDIDQRLIGQELGHVAGLNKKLGVTVSGDADRTLSKTKPDVVFLTTSSSLKTVSPQIEKCVKAKANVISTCEELAYPHRSQRKLSSNIDKHARANKVTVLGTGVNPGFLMDAWPLFMTGVCQEVRAIKSVRVQNASSRRGPFQKKIGAGKTLEEFAELVRAGAIRHVGLSESVAMIADGLGWKLDDITESIEPVISTSSIKTEFATVQPGQASGVRQVGKGFRSGKEVITLEFEASVTAPESYDAVFITGLPDLEVVIKGGTHGDIATAALVVNCVHRVVNAPPGLTTMKDLPVVPALGTP